MNVDIKVLDILFRRMSPGRIWDGIHALRSITNRKEEAELLHRFGAVGLQGYSLDEQKIIFQYIQSRAKKLAENNCTQDRDAKKPAANYCAQDHGEDLPLPKLAFFSVLDVAKQLLVEEGGEPLCREENILLWREAYLNLGQDLFVCAYLASEDLTNGKVRKDFTWPAVIRTNYRRLNHMLARGVAENHQHLYGSSQTLHLSWCSLMNYPESHLKIDKNFERLYQPFLTTGKEEKLTSTRERVEYACLCRSYLFRWLHLDKNEYKNCPCQGDAWQCPFLLDQKADCSYAKIDSFENCPLLLRKHDWQMRPDLFLTNELPLLRAQYGAPVPQPKGDMACLDYALETSVFQVAPNAPYRSFAGERCLLYQCFRALFQREMDSWTQTIFYLYVLLKTMFRGELIQVNKQVGFENFSLYQDRKTSLFDRSCYLAELIRMALNAPLQGGAVKSLETRISPKPSKEKDLAEVSAIDSMKRFADLPVNWQQYSHFNLDSGHTGDGQEELPYFFVFHFIKRKDAGQQGVLPVCRHYERRKTVRRQAIQLAYALSSSRTLCQRVRGIDSASNEIGCPPEVFATAFRFLRHFRPSDFVRSKLFFELPAPRLSATYHVGEDFLDIASALRAIDEAVNFLELDRGDRIGHALGLGVNPETHYKLKGKRIFISKQDRLDNLVWLLYRARELGAHIDPHLYGKLKKEAEILEMDLYNGMVKGVSLTEYFSAMRLRGDDPELYRGGKYQSPSEFAHPFDQCLSSASKSVEQYRNASRCAELNYLYHYNKEVKAKGAEIQEIVVDTEYIDLMEKVQNALQEELSRKGIIIECNPSSNVLIGTFQEYSGHPIFRFNNTHLERNTQKYQKCSQLQVCVNTDDLGVFDTSQEFEYALLFRALDDLREPDGSKTYKEEEILSYLDYLRILGFDAVFPAVSSRE